MRSVYIFDFKHADFRHLIGFNAVQKHVVEHLMLVQTFIGEREREPRSVNRQIEFLQKIRQRANVVFVSVRENQRG